MKVLQEQGVHAWGSHSYEHEDNDQWTHEADWYANGWQAGTHACQGTPGPHEDAYYGAYEVGNPATSKWPFGSGLAKKRCASIASWPGNMLGECVLQNYDAGPLCL